MSSKTNPKSVLGKPSKRFDSSDSEDETTVVVKKPTGAKASTAPTKPSILADKKANGSSEKKPAKKADSDSESSSDSDSDSSDSETDADEPKAAPKKAPKPAVAAEKTVSKPVVVTEEIDSKPEVLSQDASASGVVGDMAKMFKGLMKSAMERVDTIPPAIWQNNKEGAALHAAVERAHALVDSLVSGGVSLPSEVEVANGWMAKLDSAIDNFLAHFNMTVGPAPLAHPASPAPAPAPAPAPPAKKDQEVIAIESQEHKEEESKKESKKSKKTKREDKTEEKEEDVPTPKKARGFVPVETADSLGFTDEHKQDEICTQKLAVISNKHAAILALLAKDQDASELIAEYNTRVESTKAYVSKEGWATVLEKRKAEAAKEAAKADAKAKKPEAMEDISSPAKLKRKSEDISPDVATDATPAPSPSAAKKAKTEVKIVKIDVDSVRALPYGGMAVLAATTTKEVERLEKAIARFIEACLIPKGGAKSDEPRSLDRISAILEADADVYTVPRREYNEVSKPTEEAKAVALMAAELRSAELLEKACAIFREEFPPMKMIKVVPKKAAPAPAPAAVAADSSSENEEEVKAKAEKKAEKKAKKEAKEAKKAKKKAEKKAAKKESSLDSD